jgi:proteic killer suppression protein
VLVSRGDARYKGFVIIGFRHKGLEAFYKSGSLRGIQPASARKLGMILAILDVAKDAQDLSLPSLRLHALKGDLKGHWSIWVNGNWRVTFRFTGVDVELVDYQDYH